MDRASALGSACDACRVGKLRCSKERPACRTCSQKGRECRYSSRVVRSPLTRLYLTSVEHRLRRLEALFTELLPEVDIEQALSAGASSSHTKVLNRTSDDYVQGDQPPSEHDGVFPEAVPAEPDGFDWREETSTINELADGMAALSVEPVGTGYLGSTSGVVFLRSLLPWTGSQNANTPSVSGTASSGEAERRVLPQLSDSMLSHHIRSQLIDAYFENYHHSYPFIHQATFRAQYSEMVHRPEKRAWELLFYTVLVLGAWTLGDEQSDIDEMLYRKAHSVWEDHSIFESASLTLVQALILLSNFVQKRNKPNTGWNYLGLAVRMALSLGLHRELPSWDISLLQREMRRRAWWGLFIFDSGASTTFGRTILLPEIGMIDVKQVSNIHDELLTPMTTRLPADLLEPTIYSSLRAQAEFHIVTNSVSNRLLSAPTMSTGEALAANQALESWTTKLPPYLRVDQPNLYSHSWHSFARAKLWWRYWNLQIILFRPFLMRCANKEAKNDTGDVITPEEDHSRDICLSAAHLTINSIEEYMGQNAPSRLAAWYALYFLFHAALVSCVRLCTQSEFVDASAWKADIDTTRRVLFNAFGGNLLATRCMAVLDRILPQSASSESGHRSHIFEPQAIDFSLWPVDMSDPLTSFEWAEPQEELL